MFGVATFTVEDVRFDYNERRFITLGILEVIVITIQEI